MTEVPTNHAPNAYPAPISGRAKISGTESTPDEVTIHYLVQHPPSSSSSRGTILLIHGFPETSYQFRLVMGPLASRGWTVVAPDYRGAGRSSHPALPHTKAAMAADLHTLLHAHLHAPTPVHVVGQDIGGMVAHAYATRHGADTASVAWGECPLPGTAAYDGFKHDPAMWHFTFHWQQDLPEQLVAGRERTYIRHFYDRLAHRAAAFDSRDLDVYEDAFSRPGAMRCGFDAYRAFHQDARDNRDAVERSGRCRVPALALNGDHSFAKDLAESMFAEMYESFEMVEVKDSGHWTAEENPADFVDKVAAWAEKNEK